jgi:hypothetical protein
MLKFNSIFKNRRKFWFSTKYYKQANQKPDNDQMNNPNKEILQMNEKFTFFISSQKPLNFVDLFINKNEKEILQSESGHVFNEINKSISENKIDLKNIQDSSQLYYFYNFPHEDKLSFEESLKSVLRNLYEKDIQFFYENNNKELFLKIFHLQIKINLDSYFHESFSIFKKLQLGKHENELTLNTFLGYLEYNINLLDRNNIIKTISIFKEFLSIARNLNLINMFQNNINNYFTTISKFILCEKFDYLEYHQEGEILFEKIISQHKEVFDPFQIDFYKFFINSDYNINEDIFILDNINLDQFSFSTLFSIFENYTDAKDMKFDKDFAKNYFLLKNYGRKFYYILNKSIISKNTYFELKNKFTTMNNNEEVNKAYFYFLSIFANKFNDLEFFIDYEQHLENPNNKKENFYYLNCLIKNVKASLCENFDQIEKFKKNMQNLSEIDEKAIKTILDFKRKDPHANKNYLQNYLDKELTNALYRKLILSLKYNYPGQNLAGMENKIMDFVEKLKFETKVNLAFEIKNCKKSFLKTLIKLGEISEEKYLDLLGISKRNYFLHKVEKLKYGLHIRNKSIFSPNQKLDQTTINLLCEILHPYLGEDILKNKIKNW